MVGKKIVHISLWFIKIILMY